MAVVEVKPKEKKIAPSRVQEKAHRGLFRRSRLPTDETHRD